jgi:hypothetical protein
MKQGIKVWFAQVIFQHQIFFKSDVVPELSHQDDSF